MMDMLLHGSAPDDSDHCTVECTCCIFRKRRASLVKKLCKLRRFNEEIDRGNTPLKSASHAILKQFKEHHLQTLISAIETKGIEVTPCVLVPRSDLSLGNKQTMSPQFIVCKIWRWPELSDTCKFKQSPQCQTQEDKNLVCCNPYHCSVVTELCGGIADYSTTDLIPHQDSSSVKHETTESRAVSTETGLTPSCLNTSESGTAPCWMRIAYWEHRDRIGPLSPIRDPFVHVFQYLPRGCGGDGICLRLLQTASRDERVNRTREKIGFGVILCREAESLWIYNRSEFPVFVNSPIFPAVRSSSFIVAKVFSGYSMKIFNFGAFRRRRRSFEPPDGPFDVNSIRVSFTKGWGPGYSRQFITSCPCWLELLMNDR